jgi:Tfp pilus assembly protein PilF
MISKNEVVVANFGWNTSKMQQTATLYDVWLLRTLETNKQNDKQTHRQTNRHINKRRNYGPDIIIRRENTFHGDPMHTSCASTKIMKPVTEAQK